MSVRTPVCTSPRRWSMSCRWPASEASLAWVWAPSCSRLMVMACSTAMRAASLMTSAVIAGATAGTPAGRRVAPATSHVTAATAATRQMTSAISMVHHHDEGVLQGSRIGPDDPPESAVVSQAEVCSRPLEPGRRRARRGPSARRGCPLRRCGPSSSTTMRSASRMVVSRWAITSAVRPTQRLFECGLHVGLVLVVEVAGGLVEDDHDRVLQQQPGDRQPLLLAAAEPIAALADHGVVAVGQRRDHVVDAGAPAGGVEFGHRGVGLGIAQVVADRLVEQVRVLGDDADRRTQRLLGEIANVVCRRRGRCRR